MAGDAEELEVALHADLATLGERFGRDGFSEDLYRALTNRRWRKQDGPEGHVALSWSRAETLVNALRREQGHEPLTLAQTGGEGELSRTIAEDLSLLGWSSEPEDTSGHDDAHVSEPVASPPPADTGERRAPDPNTRDWEREAHEDAEANRRA